MSANPMNEIITKRRKEEAMKEWNEKEEGGRRKAEGGKYFNNQLGNKSLKLIGIHSNCSTKFIPIFTGSTC